MHSMPDVLKPHPEKWKAALLLTVLSGLLYAFPHPPFSLHFVAWIALVPFLIAISLVRPALAGLCGVVWSLVATIGVAWWIPAGVAVFFLVPPWIAVLALLVVCLITALFVAPFASWASWMSRRSPASPFLIGAAWGPAEYGRANFMGNPYYLFGYAQNTTTFIEVADIAGIYGVSILLVTVNAALAGLLLGRRRWSDASVVALIVAAYIYGAFRMSQHYGVGPPIRVAIIQGGMSYPVLPDAARRAVVLAKYQKLAAIVARQEPDIAFLPEHAADADLQKETDLLKKLSAGRETLIGGIHYEAASLYYNSMFLVENGVVTGRYDKYALMPVAEDDKLQRMGMQRGAFHRGRLLPLRARAAALGVLICSEALVPSLARRLTAQGAELLVNPSSDEWLQFPLAARAEYESSAVRAIENRRYMVRPVTTGYSAVIDPAGRPIVESRFAGEAILFADVWRVRERTLYSRWGDAPLIVLLLVLIVVSFHNRLRHN